MSKNNPKHKSDSKAKDDQIQAPKGQKLEKVQSLNARGTIEYNGAELDKFFDTVFHADMQEDEYILGWSANTNTPSFPKIADKVVERLERTGLAKACYFGTSTVGKAEDGKVYNRKSLFKRLHVVVLDDIGTKVDMDSLPEDLAPNYIIESSEGNFQYGFVLDEPIEDYALAEALIHLVYTSGFSDTGGKMPNKVVRMPCGINGKEGEKGDFNVRLTHLDNEYWSPSELLDVLNVGVSWDAVLEDVNNAKQGRSASMVGTSLWSPIRPSAASLNGVIDPVLEWLYENDLVVNDNGEWVTIKCPWHKDHTDENSITAGYSPVGRGGEYSNMRAFHCFHDHCSDKKAHEFLQHVAIESGIHAPVFDNVADLVADYAFVGADNSACRIRGVRNPVAIPMASFKTQYGRKVEVFDLDGKRKLFPEHALWVTSPSRLTVQGYRYDPAKTERVIEYDGLKYINMYSPAPWGTGAYDKNDVDTFKQFIEYIVPTESEREYFMNWLAAKAQNVTFRGAGILMYTPTKGTGRTTLTDMMSELFTHENTKKVTFPKLCGVVENGMFNDFLMTDIVFCDEVISSQHNKFKVMEALKELIDPRPKTMMVNPKYAKGYQATVYTSYVMLTNHPDAIGDIADDRRIYAIENPTEAASPEYFNKLNEWLSIKDSDGSPKWSRSVWRWLQTLKPDLPLLLKPAPSTKVKEEMVNLTTHEVDVAIQGIIKYFDGVVPNGLISQLVREVFDYRADPSASDYSKFSKTVYNKMTKSTDVVGLRIAGRLHRFRVGVSYKYDEAKVKAGMQNAKTLVENDNGLHKAVVEISSFMDENIL